MKRRLDLRPALLMLAIGLTARAQPVLIRAGRLVDPANGTASTGQQILVENGVIKSVGANLAAPAGAQGSTSRIAPCCPASWTRTPTSARRS